MSSASCVDSTDTSPKHRKHRHAKSRMRAALLGAGFVVRVLRWAIHDGNDAHGVVAAAAVRGYAADSAMQPIYAPAVRVIATDVPC